MSDKQQTLKAAIIYNKNLIDTIAKDLDEFNKDRPMDELRLMITEKRINIITYLKKQINFYKKEYEN